MERDMDLKFVQLSNLSSLMHDDLKPSFMQLSQRIGLLNKELEPSFAQLSEALSKISLKTISVDTITNINEVSNLVLKEGNVDNFEEDANFNGQLEATIEDLLNVLNYHPRKIWCFLLLFHFFIK